MENLTITEERIMQVLWKIKKGFVKDIIDQLPNPRPPYNTISSVVRILEKKEFVDHKAYGKTHEYFPIIEKQQYAKFTFKNLFKGYFEGSYKELVSFLVKEEKLSEKEIWDTLELLNKTEKQK